MKKALKVTMGAAIAAAALTPAAALAAEAPTPTDAKTGFYNIKTGEFVGKVDFKALEKAEKAALITNPDVFVVVAGTVYQAGDLLKSSAALGEGTPEATFEADKGIELTADGTIIKDNEVMVPDPSAKALELAKAAVEALPTVANVTVDNKAAVAAAAVLVADAKTAGADVAALEATVEALNTKIAELEAAATTLAVESVSAINASQILVTFSKEVDKTTAETVTNYTINGTVGTTTLVTAAGAVKPAVLQADKKSVLLTLNQTNVPYSKGKALAVTVNAVQQADDASKVINQFAQSITLNDTTAAAITSVESKAATTTTTVTFKVSEPIVTTGAVFKVNGETVAAGPTQSATNPLEYTITTASPLVAGQTYKLEVYNLKDTSADVAGSKPANLLTTTQQFTVVGQTSTAGLQTVTAKGDNKIELVFADAVDKTSLELATNVKVLLPDGTALANAGDFTVAQDTKDPKKATISLTNASNKLYSAANDITLTVIVTDAVKDSVGNSQPLKQQTVKLTKDTVAPIATNARALKDATGKITGFEVTYDSNLTVATPTTTGLRVINAKGTEITTNLGFATSTGAVVATAPNKLTVTLPAAVAISSDVSGTVRLILPEIVSLTDDSTQINKAQATTVNVVLDASTSDAIAVTSAADAGSVNKYTVVFSKDPKVDDVLNNTNYKLNGDMLPADTLITYVAATKTATIEVPNAFAKKGDTSAILAVSDIRSANETETVATYYGSVTLVDKVAPVLTAAALNADNTVTLTFDEALAAVPTTTNALEIKINNTVTGTLAATAATGSDAGAGKYVIDLGSLVKFDVGATATYLDINGDGTKDANEPVFATSDITSNQTALANLLKNNSLVSAITFGTIASPTVADAAGNTAKGGIIIKVK